MAYVTMSDIAQAGSSSLGQVMTATGGGGGGGAVLARQATQARGYVMPGHTPPALVSAPSIMTVSRPPTMTPPSAPPTMTPPSAPPPTMTPPGSPVTTGGPGVVGGGYAYAGRRERRGRIEGEDVYRQAWERTTTTYTPGYTIRGQPAYVEGERDPTDMFASSSVDEGVTEEREFIDTTGGQQSLPRAGEGPQKVFRIEDDPTLNDLGQTSPGGSSDAGWRRAASIFAAGAVVGVVGSMIAARFMR